VGGHGLSPSDSGQGQTAGSCEHDSETWGSVRYGTICSFPEKLLASQEGLCPME
jgi:hypothetical protein